MNEADKVKLYQSFFLFGDQTTLKILRELINNEQRTFTELRDGIPVNPASLSKKLQLLQSFNVVEKSREKGKQHVNYSLKEHKKIVKKIIDDIELFSQGL